MQSGKGIICLSVFDGISCGRIALERARIKVDKYYASEIDKNAINITQKNFSNTIQLGDVRNWKNWNINFSEIDLLLAGFPCQSWSVSGLQKGILDERGQLLFDLIDIWKHIDNEKEKCNKEPVKFLFENVRMKSEFMLYISNLFQVEPIKINSALVSAQNRERLYWTNIPINTIPEDKGLTLKDIISDVAHHKITIKHPETIRRTKNYAQYDQTLKGHGSQDQRFFYLNGKSGCITKSRSSIPKVEYGDEIILLLPEEVEKLQTVPTGYTSSVKTQDRYAMLGNGWTVDVIAHILKNLYITKEESSSLLDVFSN